MRKLGLSINYIFYLFLSFFLFLLGFYSPNLSGRRLNVYHTCTHGVALGLKCTACGWLKIQDAKKSPSRHHRTSLSSCIFATKSRIGNCKKNLLNSNISSTHPDNMVNFGRLTAEIVSGVWGTPANFNGFRVLAALLHGSGRQPNF